MAKKKTTKNSPLTEQQLIGVLRSKAQQFLSTPGVTSVGVGYKIKDGKRTDQLSIQFTVEQKLEPEALEAAQISPLPPTITDDDGNVIPVDVVERTYKPAVEILSEAVQEDVRQRRRSRQNPILPGISVAHVEGSAGTIGAIVYDRKTGEPYVLSNWHVLHTSSGRIGDRILQPGPFDGGDRAKSLLGRVVRSHLGLAGDCAISTIENRGIDSSILELGTTPQQFGKTNLGDRVVKSGRTTGVTHGIVERVGVVVNLNYSGATGTRQIGGFEVRPDPDKPAPDGEISMGGDSGSLWLASAGEDGNVAVGLHFAGEADPDPNAEHALACNIHSVLQKLDVSFSAGAAAGSECALVRRHIQAAENGIALEGPADPDDEILTPEQLDELEKFFAENPRVFLERARRAVDEDVTEEDLAYALDEVRLAYDNSREVFPAFEARSALEASPAGLPPEFSFPGMDLDRIPINWKSRQFEAVGDLLRWIIFAGGAIPTSIVKAPFRINLGSHFDYKMEEPSSEHPIEIALFADWGTGLYHSRYIASQFAGRKFPYAIHGGDVYYAGRPSEFKNHVMAPLRQVLPHTEVFMLNANHEMYTGGRSYFRFIDDKREAFPDRQRQVGSYFTLRSGRFQFIGIDTAYHEDGRFEQRPLLEWLDRRLREGRQAGQANILVSANEPYEYGSRKLTELFRKDLKDVISDRVDLWFWGNTHYCALFDRQPKTPFIGSCIGHGGFPYRRQRVGERVPAPLRFLETGPRFPEWTGLRQGRGNNGYCALALRVDGTVSITYLDWMSNVRCVADLERTGPAGAMALSRVQELLLPPGP